MKTYQSMVLCTSIIISTTFASRPSLSVDIELTHQTKKYEEFKNKVDEFKTKADSIYMNFMAQNHTLDNVDPYTKAAFKELVKLASHCKSNASPEQLVEISTEKGIVMRNLLARNAKITARLQRIKTSHLLRFGY